MDLAEADVAVRAAAGEDIDDAVARLLALVGIQQQHQLLLFVQRAMEIVGDHAARIGIADMIFDARADGGEVIPDIGFDGIAEFVVAALVAIDVAEFDFGKKIVVLPGRFAPDADGGFEADLVGCDDAVGVIGACGALGTGKRSSTQRRRAQREDTALLRNRPSANESPLCTANSPDR